MPRATPFRLNRTGLLLALISTAFAGQAGAAAGRVEFAVGPATVVGVDGRTRPAGRGTEVDTGDVVRTNDGRVQMRMADGAFISLQPNTEFGIKDYKFEGRTDGSENALFSLVKGAMRTVTGLIGRVNRNKFLVTTPTATIGIRGTGGLIQILLDGATLVQGTSGIWYLANPAGSIDIPAGVAGIAPVDPKQPPKVTVQIPAAGPSPLPALIEFVQGEERTDDGSSIIGGTPVTLTGQGTALGFTPFVQSGDTFAATGVNATFINGQVVEIEGATGRAGAFRMSLGSGGSHADFGSDGLLTWGRWIGPVTIECTGCTTSQNFGPNEGLHYVVGTPTPVMPTIGTARYLPIGSTQPTFVDGSGTGTFSFTANGGLFVDFSPQGNITLSGAQVAMPSFTYELNGSTPTGGNTFSMTPTVNNGACSGCSSTVDGFFAGLTAERAGIAYHIIDPDIKKEVIGAAALQALPPTLIEFPALVAP